MIFELYIDSFPEYVITKKSWMKEISWNKMIVIDGISEFQRRWLYFVILQFCISCLQVIRTSSEMTVKRHFLISFDPSTDQETRQIRISPKQGATVHK